MGEIIDMEEFEEAWGKGLGGWNIEVKISEEQVHVNNDMGENKLWNPQYNFAQWNEKYSRERSQEIVEQEMPGMRKYIHKG